MTGDAIPAPTRRLLGPALMTAVMLAILISLGVWQLQRREWKHALLARIDAAAAAAPVALSGDAAPPPFARITVEGQFAPGATGRYGASVETVAGASLLGSQILAVLDRPHAVPLLVSLGWLPDAAPVALPPGPVRLVGYARLPDHPSWLSATDNPAARRFYTLDPSRIGPALGASPVAPFTLVALEPVAWPGAPVPNQAMPRPPDDHLQYALTWFGLAAALAVIFSLYARRGGRIGAGIGEARPDDFGR